MCEQNQYVKRSCCATTIILSAALLIGACAAAEIADDPSGDPSTTALVKDKPWVPGWCRWDWRAGWVGQHNGFLERTKKGGIDVVFFGDSITRGWDKEIWNEKYAPLKAVNYGIGGDSTRQILWRVKHGELDGLNPKLIVLMIGTNNLYDDANGGSDDEIAKGIETLVQYLREKQPNAKILLLGLLPRQNEWFSGRVKKINSSIAKLDDAKTIRYLDIGDKFIDAPGKVKPDLYNKDQLHLAKKGYEVWAESMQPLLTEMLK